MSQKRRTRRIDLGLAILAVLRQPAVRYTVREIAAWCDCSPTTIINIEQRALRKIRKLIGPLH